MHLGYSINANTENKGYEVLAGWDKSQNGLELLLAEWRFKVQSVKINSSKG